MTSFTLLKYLFHLPAMITNVLTEDEETVPYMRRRYTGTTLTLLYLILRVKYGLNTGG